MCILKRDFIPGDKLCEELENTLCELQGPPHCGKIAPGDRDHDRDIDQPSNKRSGARQIISIFVNCISRYPDPPSCPSVFIYSISLYPPSCPSAPHGKLADLVQSDKPGRCKENYFHNRRFTSMVQLPCYNHYHFHAIIVIIVSSKVC